MNTLVWEIKNKYDKNVHEKVIIHFRIYVIIEVIRLYIEATITVSAISYIVNIHYGFVSSKV